VRSSGARRAKKRAAHGRDSGAGWPRAASLATCHVGAKGLCSRPGVWLSLPAPPLWWASAGVRHARLPAPVQRRDPSGRKGPRQEASPAGAVADLGGLGVDVATGRRIPVAIHPLLGRLAEYHPWTGLLGTDESRTSSGYMGPTSFI
jgi:hypothetical protein